MEISRVKRERATFFIFGPWAIFRAIFPSYLTYKRQTELKWKEAKGTLWGFWRKAAHFIQTFITASVTTQSWLVHLFACVTVYTGCANWVKFKSFGFCITILCTGGAKRKRSKEENCHFICPSVAWSIIGWRSTLFSLHQLRAPNFDDPIRPKSLNLTKLQLKVQKCNEIKSQNYVWVWWRYSFWTLIQSESSITFKKTHWKWKPGFPFPSMRTFVHLVLSPSYKHIQRSVLEMVTHPVCDVCVWVFGFVPRLSAKSFVPTQFHTREIKARFSSSET